MGIFPALFKFEIEASNSQLMRCQWQTHADANAPVKTHKVLFAHAFTFASQGSLDGLGGCACAYVFVLWSRVCARVNAYVCVCVYVFVFALFLFVYICVC